VFAANTVLFGVMPILVSRRGGPLLVLAVLASAMSALAVVKGLVLVGRAGKEIRAEAATGVSRPGIADVGPPPGNQVADELRRVVDEVERGHRGQPVENVLVQLRAEATGRHLPVSDAVLRVIAETISRGDPVVINGQRD
jgi:hypothetical protein